MHIVKRTTSAQMKPGSKWKITANKRAFVLTVGAHAHALQRRIWGGGGERGRESRDQCANLRGVSFLAFVLPKTAVMSKLPICRRISETNRLSVEAFAVSVMCECLR